MGVGGGGGGAFGKVMDQKHTAIPFKLAQTN